MGRVAWRGIVFWLLVILGVAGCVSFNSVNVYVVRATSQPGR